MSLLRNIRIPQNLGNKFAHAFASCTRPSRLGLEFEASPSLDLIVHAGGCFVQFFFFGGGGGGGGGQ